MRKDGLLFFMLVFTLTAGFSYAEQKGPPMFFSAGDMKIDPMYGPGSIQSMYCSAGKQVKSLKFNAIGVVPKPVRGLAADEAAQIQSGQRDFIRKIAKFYFIYGSSWDRYSGFGSDYYLSENPVLNGPLQRVILTANKAQNFIEAVKDTEFEGCSDFNNWHNDLHSRDGCATFVFFPDSRQLVISVVGLPTLVEKDEAGSLFDRGPKFYLRDSYSGYHPHRLANIFVTVGEEASIKLRDKPPFADFEIQNGLLLRTSDLSNVRNSLPEVKVFKAPQAIPLEGFGLVQNFTLLIPYEKQRKLFFPEARESEFKDLDPKDDLDESYFLKADKTFNLKRAIEHRKDVWWEYFSQFVSVEESPGKDAQEIKFEVSLDLKLFCQYGRLISELQSR